MINNFLNLDLKRSCERLGYYQKDDEGNQEKEMYQCFLEENLYF
jgi:hypothetical protein